MAVASSSNLSPAPATSPDSSSLLAPGFRFHPTDEELIIYYLKRKVSNRPLRVDAIAEVDLYKAEPWDLPALSRLRSRDMEWYFFSPLDRKYANRSRTNRATSQGYWKTTGKDRPIRRGPRVVGMKKTLVFHVGRAPRGERTNWVMHEYRLEDEELASAGIPQDSYVVCRIFQKSGSGPQNGAQYGAPFNEEEWEEEGNTMTLNVVDGGEADTDNLALTPVDGRDSGVVGNAEYFQLSDFVEDETRGSFLTPDSDLQNSGSAPEEDPIFLLEGIFQDPGYIDAMDPPEQQEHQSSQNDEFLELNDILDPAEFFASMNDTASSASMFQMHPFQDGFYLDTNGLNQAVEENPVFYDASSNDLPLGIENFLEIDGMYSPTAGSGGFTEVDDIASYFNSDVLDDSSENFCVDSSGSDESNFSPEVGSTVPTPVQASNFVGASSSVNLPGAGNWSNSINENVNVGPDSHGPEGWDKTLTKRVVNMLGAISAPPALAAEFPISPSKSSGQASTTNSASSSIHVTAGMIQIHGFRVNGDAGFLLSYGVASRKLDGLEPVTKIRGWSLSVVLRGGFCLFFLSAMVLALCLKVGIRVYSK